MIAAKSRLPIEPFFSLKQSVILGTMIKLFSIA